MIYVSFGMTKAGSTLAFEMTKEILEQNGMPQKRLSFEAIDESRKINFVESFSADALARLLPEVERKGHMVVIKTHQRPTPEIAELLNTGRAIGQAVYRDPRDVALSLLDAGRQARDRNLPAFRRFHELGDTLQLIKRQITWLRQWLDLPNVMPVYYEDMAFDTEATLQRIADQIGLPVRAAAARETVTRNRFTQFNKGVSQRHIAELSEEQRATFDAMFGDFIARYCGDSRPKKPRHVLALQRA